jgi:hypothetical protein
MQFNRKSTPKVKSGQVQKKNKWVDTPNYYSHPPDQLIVEKRRPGKGYRHILSRRDIIKFIGLLPNWEELGVGLNAITLAEGGYGYDGYYGKHVVHVCAWHEDLWVTHCLRYYDDHKELLDRLGVRAVEEADGYLCQYTLSQARAFQLLHILLHELGHHHDRIITPKDKRPNRGESYAEEYAFEYEAIIWDRYIEAFGLD